ncbi:MBL fold metallo-hydrolase [Roseovarius sp. E0-M6]|uniref:MBL fold metallo-hydrolase n=1 Tax=Roseovarius sp. E0-M6 TaxID=3127118 RepID=UPI0030103D5C
MKIQRRTMLKGLGAGALLGLPQQVWSAATMELGGLTVSTVSDGHLAFPAEFFFEGLPEEELTTILEQYDVAQDTLTPPCNVTVAQFGGRTVLFDCGSGPAFMPTAGKLVDGLSAMGITPEDVTEVVFTHGHPDHLWGVLDDFNDPVFTEAQYMMGRTERAYWSDPETVETIGQARASFAVGAARRLEAIAEDMSTFESGQEILPGIIAHSSFGHTPGHMSFELRGTEGALLVVGDAIGNGHVAFERPEWPSGSDQDPETAANTRARLLDMLTQERMGLIGFHLPGGGLGRVERKGDAYQFVTEEM